MDLSLQLRLEGARAEREARNNESEAGEVVAP